MKTTDINQSSKSLITSMKAVAEKYLANLSLKLSEIRFDKVICNVVQQIYPTNGISIESSDKNISFHFDTKMKNPNYQMFYSVKEDCIILPVWSLYCIGCFNSENVMTDFRLMSSQFISGPLMNNESPAHKKLISVLVHELTHKIQFSEGMNTEMIIKCQKGDVIDNAIERRAYYNEMLSFIHQQNPQTMNDIIKIVNAFKKGTTFEKIFNSNKQEFLEIANDWLDTYLNECVRQAALDFGLLV